MKRICAALLCLLFLTACGAGSQEETKDRRYEVLDGTGAVLYTIEDGELVDTLDSLLSEPLEDMEHSASTGDVEPLYTYVYCQEKTLLAGEDPDKERDYEELMRVLVPAEGETVVIQVLPDVEGLDELEGLDWLTDAVGLRDLLTSAVTVSPETAESLRSPARFVS